MAAETLELATPLRIDSSGGFATLTTIESAVASHIRSVLGTQQGERVMRPDYGTISLQHLFQPVNDAEIAKLNADISQALADWVPEANVVGIDVVDEAGFVNVTVRFSMSPSSESSVTISTPVSTG